MLIGYRSFVSAVIVLIASRPSIVNAQSATQISVGVGMGATSVPDIPAVVVFADAKWMVARPLKLGADMWYASNHDRGCLVLPGSACQLTFADFVGIVPLFQSGLAATWLRLALGPVYWSDTLRRMKRRWLAAQLRTSMRRSLCQRHSLVQSFCRPERERPNDLDSTNHCWTVAVGQRLVDSMHRCDSNRRPSDSG